MGRGCLGICEDCSVGKARCLCPTLSYVSSTEHTLIYSGQDFKRVGLSTLTDILNVVAPPISEHEVIQVWLSHDMKGYDGIETLVYRALTRVYLFGPFI